MTEFLRNDASGALTSPSPNNATEKVIESKYDHTGNGNNDLNMIIEISSPPMN